MPTKSGPPVSVPGGRQGVGHRPKPFKMWGCAASYEDNQVSQMVAGSH